jgi:riboflavin synthase
MFTGLIEDLGKVRRLERRGAAALLAVQTRLPLAEIGLGDSVAVNGVCLTAVATDRDELAFDVSPETLERSGLGRLTPGEPVNLERALRLSDRLGGHLVTGHIDGIATVVARQEVSGNLVFRFRVPAAASRYLVPKGSVALDGISLTVNDVEGEHFSVNVIPHTAAVTTLRLRAPGDRVNIETDIIGRYVERLLGERAGSPGGLSMESLLRNGFA